MTKFTPHNRRASKLTGEQILEILRAYQMGYTQSTLARQYRVTIGTIGRIVRGETHQGLTQGLLESPQDIADAAAASAERMKRIIEGTKPTVDSVTAERLLDRLTADIRDQRLLDQQLEELKK